MSFINQHSFRCLLGIQTKSYSTEGCLFLWTVGKKKHFSINGIIDSAGISYLQQYGTANFHYLNQQNIDILKQNFKIQKVKNKSIILGISNLNLTGRSMRTLRQTFNKCSKNNFEILNDYKSIDDVKKMIDEWSNEYTDKYFRDFSGKNLFFYRNNFHKECINVFVYHEDVLVSFGTLSPEVNGTCSYIIGKALYKRFYGLSEYTDLLLYKKANEHGITSVNMGQASKGLLFYKTKFPNSKEEIHYDGKIEI